jgi:hypothetical protein
MEPKYTKGQKVKIVSVKNQHGNPKYPEIEKHANETGVIIGVQWTSIRNVVGMEEYMPGDFYIYQVRLDKGITLKAVLEDALVALDE